MTTFRFALTALLALLIATNTAPGARADDVDAMLPSFSISNVGGDVEGGFKVSYGFCPCLRWTVSVKLLSGQIETRDFLISTDALFELDESIIPRGGDWAARTFKIGALEALVKGAHFGLAFEGVTLGEDRDRGYSDIFATGVQFIVNAFRTSFLRLDLRSGYEYERFRVNLAPATERHLISETVSFNWANGGRWSGTIGGRVAFDAANAPIGKANFDASAWTTVRAAIVRVPHANFGAAFKAEYRHESFREAFGLDPNIGVAGIYFDVRMQ